MVFCQLRQFYLLKFQLCFSCKTTMILPAVFNECRFQSTKTKLIIERKKLCHVDPRLSADLSTCWKTEWQSHCSVTCCCVTHGVTRFSPPAKPSSDQLTHPPILTPDNQFTSLDVTWSVIESVKKCICCGALYTNTHLPFIQNISQNSCLHWIDRVTKITIRVVDSGREVIIN